MNRTKTKMKKKSTNNDDEDNINDNDDNDENKCVSFEGRWCYLPEDTHTGNNNSSNSND